MSKFLQATENMTPGPWFSVRNHKAQMPTSAIYGGPKEATVAECVIITPDAVAICAAPEHGTTYLLLEDAMNRLAGLVGSDCECDNTHSQNATTCCLCQYRQHLTRLDEIAEKAGA